MLLAINSVVLYNSGRPLSGPPRQTRQARFGPCLDFGFQYARSYKKQPVKKILGRILALALLKFAVAALFIMTWRSHAAYLGCKTIRSAD